MQEPEDELLLEPCFTGDTQTNLMVLKASSSPTGDT